ADRRRLGSRRVRAGPVGREARRPYRHTEQGRARPITGPSGRGSGQKRDNQGAATSADGGGSAPRADGANSGGRAVSHGTEPLVAPGNHGFIVGVPFRGLAAVPLEALAFASAGQSA